MKVEPKVFVNFVTIKSIAVTKPKLSNSIMKEIGPPPFLHVKHLQIFLCGETINELDLHIVLPCYANLG